MPKLTPEDIEALSGRTLTDAEATALPSLIDLAYEDLEMFLQRSIEEEEHEDEILAYSQWVHLPASPIRSVTEVLVDGVAAEGWELERSGIKLRAAPSSPVLVTVTYSAGLGEPYSSRARLSVAARVLRTLAKIRDDALGARSMSQEGYNAAYLDEDWTEQELKRLQVGRRRVAIT